MPQIGNQEDGMMVATSAGGYAYSATKIENLNSSTNTLVEVVVDVSGSVYDYRGAIEDMLEQIREACMKSDNNMNLVMRVTTFNHLVTELHGFKNLTDIQSGFYKGTINPEGSTALTDGACESLDTLHSYAAALTQNRYTSNAIIFIVTDGEENCSVKQATAIKRLLNELRKGETLQSVEVILIGLVPKGSQTSTALDGWKNDTGIDRYVCAGEATPQKLAKVADFVSKSTSSTSQAIQTGQKSQPVAVTF